MSGSARLRSLDQQGRLRRLGETPATARRLPSHAITTSPTVADNKLTVESDIRLDKTNYSFVVNPGPSCQNRYILERDDPRARSSVVDGHRRSQPSVPDDVAALRPSATTRILSGRRLSAQEMFLVCASSIRWVASTLSLAGVAVSLAGCGSAAGHSSSVTSQPSTKHIVQPGHAVLSADQIRVGDTVTCDGAGATVLPPGQSNEAFADGVSSSVDLTVTTEQNGDVTVDCTSS